MSGFSARGVQRLAGVMQRHVDEGSVPGLAWLIARGGEVHRGVAGTRHAGGERPFGPDDVVRLSSMTKPVTAAAALVLVEDCVLRLDDPIDELLPELAGRRVLRDPAGPLDDTVPADRPITLRDLLTFRMGWGMDFMATGPQPVLQAMAELGLGIGPPAPSVPPAPDEWLRRVSPLPLDRQPGERWLYHTSSDVLGVLVARAAGQAFDAVLRERVLDPLGMHDTGFFVPAARLDRFGACFGADPATGARTVYDPLDGQWSRPPAFPSGGAGLVSTLDDYFAFSAMLLAGGVHQGRRLLSRPTIEAMTSDHLTAEQKAASGPDPSGALGWGFGVAVQVRRTGPARSLGTYGWDGGLGTSWANDPHEDLVGILLSDQAWMSPRPPAAATDFWTCAYTALD